MWRLGKKIINPNALIDARHNEPCAIKGPTDEPRERKILGIFRTQEITVDMLRCMQPGCGFLSTMWETRRWGKCKKCSGRQFIGGWPINLGEHLRFQFWYRLHNWRVFGEKGWGWR